MKNFFQMIGVITLMIGSFMYAGKVEIVSKLTDDLLNEIKSKKDGYKENATPPIIIDNKIIPGLNGREVDVEKSYQQMSRIGYFDDKLLVYKTLYTEDTLDKNKDKYIIGLNGSKMHISLIFKTKKTDDITRIIKALEDKKIKSTFFVDSDYLEKHHNQIIKLVQKGYTIGNLSKNEDYTDSDFVWMKTIITNIGKQKYNYCLTEKYNKKILKNCLIQDSYTIMPKIVIKNNYLLNIKKYLKPGNIIALDVTDDLDSQIETIISYILSKGYSIEPIERGLKE